MSLTDEKNSKTPSAYEQDVEVNPLEPGSGQLNGTGTEFDHVSDLHRNLKPR